MNLIKVASAAVNQTPFDWHNNEQNILEAIFRAEDAGVNILCLPEMCISGYGCEDQYHSIDLVERAHKSLMEIIKQSRGTKVAFLIGIPFEYQNSLFNGAALVVEGKVVGITAKRFLAGDGIHYENRWFKPWKLGAHARLLTKYIDCPIGDICYNLSGTLVGVEVCEDAWVPDRPANTLARKGVDIILNPSASHFAFGRSANRRELVKESSRQFKCTYVYSNLLGNESGRSIYSGDTLIADCGKLVAAGPTLTFRAVEMVTSVVDLDTNRTHRMRTASLRPNFDGDTNDCVNVSFNGSALGQTGGDIISPLHSKYEQFSRAVALGLHDFRRKSRTQGFVVSLSGGADSAAVACLVRLIDRYMQEDIEHYSDTTPLACVYQPTRNSSDTTLNAAKNLALELGAEFSVVDVDSIVEDYTNKVSKALGVELNWDNHDIALQNIQARARAPSVWMIANLKNALLLATSNRSEAAVGYATMDGDTCGGLSPIAGIDKAFLLEWLLYAQAEYNIQALEAINVQKPTAELRPGDQSDEDDLMPYKVLDAIQKLAIRDKKAPLEVFKELSLEYDSNELKKYIDKFFKLWARNQWKRERYAPSFHLDDENLDPKTWCRFPIISGGFIEELSDMWSYYE